MNANSTSEPLQFYPNSVNRPFDSRTEKSSLFDGELVWFQQIFNSLVEEQKTLEDRVKKDNLPENRASKQKCSEDLTTQWGRGSNIIGILGPRGSGKSSMLNSVHNWLEGKTNELSDPNIGVHCILLDPALIRGHRLATVLLTKLYAGFRKHLEKLSCASNHEEENDLNALHKEFQEVLKGLNGTILPFSADTSLQDLSLYTEVTELRVKMFELINRYLRLIGNRAEKLVLLLDDFDWEEDTLTGHLDDWWHFLNLPNVVVIMSASPTELDELLTIGRMKGRKMLLDKPCQVGATSEVKPSCLNILEMRRRAAAHLLKVMGVNRRVYLASNSASSRNRVKIILPDEEGSLENKTTKMVDFLRKYSALDLGIHVHLTLPEEEEKSSEEARSREKEEKSSEQEKAAYLRDIWNQSSLREQMLVMAFLYRSNSLQAAGDSIRVGLRDQFFSSGDLIELERVLPRWADRLAFSANVVRWLVTEQVNKPANLRLLFKDTFNINVESNWKAFLISNWIWYLLEQSEKGSTVMNFFTVESDVDAEFWGGKKWDAIDLNILNDVKDEQSKKDLEGLIELAGSRFWRSDDKSDWQLTIRPRRSPINLLNLIPQLLLGSFNEASELGFQRRTERRVPEELLDAYKTWHTSMSARFLEIHKYIKESLSNPIFFASVLMVFPRGRRVDGEKVTENKVVRGVKGFLEELEEGLVSRVKDLVKLRMEGHSGEQGMITEEELDAYFENHPLVKENFEFLVRLPEALWRYDEAEEKSKVSAGTLAKKRLELSNELKKWKLDRLFLERKQRDLAPADWAERTDAESRRTMKRLLRAIQVRISDKIHSNATEEIKKARVTYSRINNAMRMAEAGDLFQAANVVAVVFTTYIEAISQRVTEIEAQLNQLNRG